MSFDVLAPHYRWMELVLAGAKLQKCRTAFLNQISKPEQILILGEGNGRFLTECATRFSSGQITCVDASCRMLDLARKRFEQKGLSATNIEWVHADARLWKGTVGRFDLVVTHFFLDCFEGEDLNRLIAAIADACRPGAAWLLADFGIPAKGPGRWRAAVIHRLMYWFFRVVTQLPAHRLTVPDPFLQMHGFVLEKRRISEWGLLHSDLWQRGTGSGPRFIASHDDKPVTARVVVPSNKRHVFAGGFDSSVQEFSMDEG